MSDVDAKVAAAKREIATAQSARAKAEHAYQVAMASAKSAAQDLKEEFGVTSAVQARDMIASLEADLEAECTAVREALVRARTGENGEQGAA